MNTSVYHLGRTRKGTKTSLCNHGISNFIDPMSLMRKFFKGWKEAVLRRFCDFQVFMQFTEGFFPVHCIKSSLSRMLIVMTIKFLELFYKLRKLKTVLCNFDLLIETKKLEFVKFNFFVSW